ncbi:MAG: DNA repair and recombination protein RadB [Methanoregulaceae archaeon]|nr:DNA repair and recombination protein RadB [Methanoregulaceae archaeon]MCU0629002.1 DNA repair and recombination protein RadB [Methanoregulaceae archaeon]
MTLAKLSTGEPAFDDLLGGGLEPRVITQLYGGPASGKSVLCAIASVSCLKSGKGVIFIDTEGFSIERFRQVAGKDAERLAENLFLYEPHDFDHQGIMIAGIDRVLSRGGTGLVVMDSATGLYRTTRERGLEAMQNLSRQMVQLLGYAKKYDVPVLITNQVYVDVQKNVFVGLGGTALAHISKAIVRIDIVNRHRKATLEKHRSLASGRSFEFDIVETGISIRNRDTG